MRLVLLLTVLLLASPAFAQGAGARRGVGASVTQLTNVDQTLLPEFPDRIVQWCVIVGGAASEEVIFRAVDDTPEYRRETVAAGATVVVPITAPVPPGGLEVVTASAAGDVTVSCLYRVN